jgi:hypothetical protein
MIKNKLHTISDEDAIKVSELLLKSSTSSMFDFTFEKIERQPYIEQWGVDAEESVEVYFKAIVRQEMYRTVGWKDKRICIKLIESDRYHDYPYFSGLFMEETDKVWHHQSISNYIEAIEFLKEKELI